MLQYPLLQTKLHIPSIRPALVSRPRLIERLNDGLGPKGNLSRGGFAHKLTLVSAPAGYGKTTLVSKWVTDCGDQGLPAAWLSLDKEENDPVRFLTYLVAALQTIASQWRHGGRFGEGVLALLQPPGGADPPIESILAALLNEITAIAANSILVLDDYHLLDTGAIDQVLTFLLDHLPPQMHLVIATREDPHLPLARYRVRDQLTEVRVADLRFAPDEAADFLNQVMGLNLSAKEVAALEARTEGWIAGLQLAALALQGAIAMPRYQDTASFIQSFTGSHHFVLDYLLTEVLQQQPESIRLFLLQTSILDRLCGPLCDAICSVETAFPYPAPAISGQETLEYLEQANLFLIPLDNERRWYRYHPLFADLLRQRLHQQQPDGVVEYHIRASEWYEDNGLEIEAFHHAAVANDIERAERLIEGSGTSGTRRVPLHFRGAMAPILDWLASLPATDLNVRPSLWVKYASLLLITGQTTGVEEKLRAAETALAETTPQGVEPADTAGDKARNLVGHIAAVRAALALPQHQVETMIAQSRRALAYLSPDNLPLRATALWTLAHACQLQGDRATAGRTFAEAISLSQVSGDTFSTLLATIGLGRVQEAENQLHLAAERYQQALQLAGEQPLQVVHEAHLGLARVLYEWNELDAAEQHGQQSLKLAKQYDSAIDRSVICQVFLAHLKLARRDVAGAAAMLAEAEQIARQRDFVHRLPEIAAAQVLTDLHQGDLAAAAYLADKHRLPLSQARVCLAQGDPASALDVLKPLRQQVETKGWQDERLKVMVLQALALHALALQARSEQDEALHLLGEALALAEPGGFIRIFVDQGRPMAHLLSEAAIRGMMPHYVGKLLAAFEAERRGSTGESPLPASFSWPSLVEPLSQRELEILQLIAQGLSNREIGERLFLALSTVKTHNRNIYGKLQVQRRTEAVARARELGLL